ncbi:hypothetical protein [Paenibacillus sp. 1001270B_150601_E10]|uniref:hypothetical protein n=1 Tax=Paenibacillus sp. 1001270B_150601_E10 TaxID=2787079 RepID=UPI0018A06E5D|nr:hypothetical protein [Paenibacillus sp. 1001270B_150601_E10]
MFHTRLKQISYVIIAAGVLLLLLGLWYTIPRSVESTTPEHVYWTWTVMRISFPLSGLTLIVIGVLNLRMFRLVQEETLQLRKELAELRQRIDHTDGK